MLYRSLILPTREQAAQVEVLVKDVLQLRGLLGFLRPDQMPQSGYTETFDIRVISPAEVFSMITGGAALLPPVAAPATELEAAPELAELAAPKKGRFAKLKDKFLRKAGNSPVPTTPVAPKPEARVPAPSPVEPIPRPRGGNHTMPSTPGIARDEPVEPALEARSESNARLATRTSYREDPYTALWSTCSRCGSVIQTLLAVVAWSSPQCLTCRRDTSLMGERTKWSGLAVTTRTRRKRPDTAHRFSLVAWEKNNEHVSDALRGAHKKLPNGAFGFIPTAEPELLAQSVMYRLEVDHGLTLEESNEQVYRCRSYYLDAQYVLVVAQTELLLLNSAAEAVTEEAFTPELERTLRSTVRDRWAPPEELLRWVGDQYDGDLPVPEWRLAVSWTPRA